MQPNANQPCATERARLAGCAADPLMPPIDFAHLRRYTMGDVVLENEVLDLFFGQVPETLAALRDAPSSIDARRAAHTLKGSGRAVGAWAIAKLAEQAEVLSGRDDDGFFANRKAFGTLVTAIEQEIVIAKAFTAAVHQTAARQARSATVRGKR